MVSQSIEYSPDGTQADVPVMKFEAGVGWDHENQGVKLMEVGAGRMYDIIFVP